jgi:hypothetical protein
VVQSNPIRTLTIKFQKRQTRILVQRNTQTTSRDAHRPQQAMITVSATRLKQRRHLSLLIVDGVCRSAAGKPEQDKYNADHQSPDIGASFSVLHPGEREIAAPDLTSLASSQECESSADKCPEISNYFEEMPVVSGRFKIIIHCQLVLISFLALYWSSSSPMRALNSADFMSPCRT